jgi:hypothetical protein
LFVLIRMTPTPDKTKWLRAGARRERAVFTRKLKRELAGNVGPAAAWVLKYMLIWVEDRERKAGKR